ncbi:MAG: MurT ligase domain-containing protein [Thermomicrobium sp.]|nr:MurT ligase domain-containing protein [Thermomicrobium sp.]
MDLRIPLAIASGRIIAWMARRLGLGGGTALPGLVALRLAPDLLTRLAARLPSGAVVVAGTNGKTTTARLLAESLRHAGGLRVVHNRSGSNLPRGIAAAFLEATDRLGRLTGDIAVLEVDEFAFPLVLRAVRPRLVVLLNVFRDQLDRYGELETVARLWRGALAELPPETILVVNADDPVLAALTEPFAARRWTFGLDDPSIALPALPHAADWRLCPHCGATLAYEAVFLGHLGHYRCSACTFHRPPVTVAGIAVRQGPAGSDVWIRWNGRAYSVRSRLTGVYNAYNLIGAASAAVALGLEPGRALTALAEVPAAFGRQERVQLAGRDVTLLLIKNPTGFNEAIRLLVSSGCSWPVLILINDLDADGRDVSWLWDVDLEALQSCTAPVSAGGIRSGEIALRLDYAGIPPAARYPGVVTALDRWLQTLPPRGSGWVLATYTAMLELRRALARRGAAVDFWTQ